MSAEDQLVVAVDLIRSYGAVAVLGAGLSATRFPMTAQLPSLLWHAIDSDLAARARLAVELGEADGPAKKLIGGDGAALEAGWQVVERNRRVREAFQQAFARLDADREPTPAHYAIARLVHAGFVEYVVSFNWDTALERAHEQLFGTALTGEADVLAKPHGDAAVAQDDWVLPHQSGVVPQHVLDRMAGLSSQRPHVLLIIGYSGSDEDVVQHLLNPVEDRWPVVRVSPAASGPEGVAGFADEVMPAMADALNAQVDMVGWRWVGFTRSRDLRAALMGYRLGPQDVRTCPELAGARAVAERLRQTGFAVIVGESGAGKSITAFQAAYALNRGGWSVVELTQPGVASTEMVRTFESIRGRVVAVVDDAQALAPGIIHEFERAASADHAVVIVATERAPGQEQVKVVAAKAVGALVRYCEEHSDIVEPLVSEIDNRVGFGIGNEPFAQRLEAAKNSEYPWQFMYVLSGGEQRIGGALASLADEDEADLLFGILAAAQILSLDSGTTRDRLVSYAELAGRDSQWLENGLIALAERRLVVNREDRLRTPHMRIADRGLLALSRDETSPRWRTLVAFLRSRLIDPAEPLQGKLWVLQTIDQSDPLRYGNKDVLLDDGAAWWLVDACLTAKGGRERSIAAYLLWEIGWWRALGLPMAEKIAEVLPQWILESTSDDVYGIRWLLGGMRSNFPDLHGAVSSRVQPEEVARRLEEYGTPDAGESWGHLLYELVNASGVDTKVWAARFQGSIDTDRVAAWVRTAPGTFSLRGPIELVHELDGFAPRAAAAVIAAMTPALVVRLERDLAGAARDLVPWSFSVFGLVGVEDEAFWQAEPDYRALRDAVSNLVAATDWEASGRSLTHAQLHEMDQIELLTYSLHRFAPAALTRMTSSVSLDELDRITEGQWGDLSKIEHVVVSLGQGADHEPARSWVHRHQGDIQRMPTRIVCIAPQVAVELVARGRQIDIDVAGGLRWGECAEALGALLAADRAAALAVVESASAGIVEGLTLKHANTIGDLGEFVAVLDAIDPSLLLKLLEALDPAAVRQRWSERLGGSAEEAAAANLVIDRSLQTSGPIKAVARALRNAPQDPAL